MVCRFQATERTWLVTQSRIQGKARPGRRQRKATILAGEASAAEKVGATQLKGT
jgi:hypothetical protein